MNRLTCDCSRVLGFEDRHRGKKVKCSGCGQALDIPESDSLRLVEEELPPPRKPDPREYEDDEEERRREHRARRNRPTKTQLENGAMGKFADLLVDHNWVFWVLGILGLVGIIFGYREGALSSGSSNGPQTITLEKLIADGPGDNKHVLITDVLAARNIVITKSTKSNSWASVYIPILPITARLRAEAAAGRVPEVRPDALRAIVVSYNARSDADISTMFAQGTLKGTVVNSITGLGEKVRDLLKSNYPGTDFDKVLIIEEGRAPMSRGLSLLLFGGGIGLIALALGLGLVAMLFRNSL